MFLRCTERGGRKGAKACGLPGEGGVTLLGLPAKSASSGFSCLSLGLRLFSPPGVGVGGHLPREALSPASCKPFLSPDDSQLRLLDAGLHASSDGTARTGSGDMDAFPIRRLSLTMALVFGEPSEWPTQWQARRLPRCDLRCWFLQVHIVRLLFVEFGEKGFHP